VPPTTFHRSSLLNSFLPTSFLLNQLSSPPIIDTIINSSAVVSQEPAMAHSVGLVLSSVYFSASPSSVLWLFVLTNSFGLLLLQADKKIEGLSADLAALDETGLQLFSELPEVCIHTFLLF
jgi:hypothetical protein